MIKTVGDIWDYNIVVTPTNLGHNRLGHNIMGAGLAKQAKERYPDLPERYGRWLTTPSAEIPMLCQCEKDKFVILFPTKPLNTENPHLSWRLKSDIFLIERGLVRLSEGNFIVSNLGKIAVPLLGCGLGGLNKQDVLPLMEKYLDDSFILVER